jgi:hypothetical protein
LPDDVTDPALATLATVLDPVGLATSLRPVLPRHLGALQEARAHVLKHYPGKRCTLAIGLRTTSGWHEVIGKVYATDRSDVYQALDGIRQAGFGPDAAFSIPQPLVFVPALRLLLLESVQGTAARDIVLAGHERERALAAQQCAYWLARFQALAPRAGPIFDLSTHLRVMNVRLRDNAGLDGPVAEKAHRLFEQLDVGAARRGVSPTPGGVCAGHGSYSPSHVILGADRTVVIDWDGYSVADPARDVARFLVALKRLALGHLGSIRALDAVADVFAQAYIGLAYAGPKGPDRHAGPPFRAGSDVAARLPYYEAAICLQFASNMARRGRPDWQMKVETMLDEGLRLLQEQD